MKYAGVSEQTENTFIVSNEFFFFCFFFCISQFFVFCFFFIISQFFVFYSYIFSYSLVINFPKYFHFFIFLFCFLLFVFLFLFLFFFCFFFCFFFQTLQCADCTTCLDKDFGLLAIKGERN